MMRPALFVLALIASAPASAHSWYTGIKNADGQLCCSGSDCAPLPAGDVTEVEGGYYTHTYDQVVPFSRVQPSPDGDFHACFWGGRIRCFFGPVSSF